MKKIQISISLNLFSISPCRWRNGWSISLWILFISAGKKRILLEYPLKIKKYKYPFLSICFPFLLVGGEMDEPFHLEFDICVLDIGWNRSSFSRYHFHFFLTLVGLTISAENGTISFCNREMVQPSLNDLIES
jgi:hypothetical protein